MTFALFINRVTWYLEGLFSLFTMPICFISVPAVAIIDLLTFGFFLKVCNVIWTVLFLVPLLLMSRLWELAPILRLPIAIIGVPLAAIAKSYIGILPSLMPMWNYGSKIPDMLLCESFPFTWDCLQLEMGRLPRSSEKFYNLNLILSEYSKFSVHPKIAMPIYEKIREYLDNVELKPRFTECFLQYLIDDIPNVIGTGLVFFFLWKIHWVLAVVSIIPTSFLIGVIISRIFLPNLWKQEKFYEAKNGNLTKLSNKL